jgi:glucan biosynthesis protein
MRFIKKEHHRMTSTFTYDIPDEDIVDSFGSVDRFKEIISHLAGDEWTEPYGENPTDDEENLFYEFYEAYDYDRDDDLWTDRKGGYDVTFEYDDVDDDYDSDQEALH